MLIGLAASAPAVLAVAAFDGVRALQGTMATRESRGLVVLGILVVCGVGAGAVTAWRAQRDSEVDVVPWAPGRRLTRLAVAVIAIVSVALFGLSASQHHDAIVDPLQGASNDRLTNVETNRGDFWRVARHAFVRHPVAGIGRAGSRRSGYVSARSHTPPVTHTRSTSRRRRNSGSSGCCYWQACSWAWWSPRRAHSAWMPLS